jgi:putative hydrolase of the HAD superfamily
MIVMPAIQAVFFDAVGTVMIPHPSVAETYVRFGNRYNCHLTTQQVGSLLRPAYSRQEMIDQERNWRTSEEREKERWKTIIGEVLPEVDVEACFHDLWNWYSRPVAWQIDPEVEPLLKNLEAHGLRLGIASNFDARLAPLVETMAPLRPLASRCIISSLVGYRKPAAEFFEKVIESAGVPAANILYVGDDRRNDFEGAQASGLQALLLDPKAALSGDGVIRNLEEVAEWTKKRGEP